VDQLHMPDRVAKGEERDQGGHGPSLILHRQL
jgi:hypothetical protein